MLARIVALAFLLLIPSVAGAQTSTLPGFPPGVFQSRGALDAASGGGSNVTPDVVGTEKFQAASNSFSYTGLTITAGLTNSALVCVLSRAHLSNDVTTGLAMTWNGVAMTLRISQGMSVNGHVSAIFGLRNPASGNQTLAVSATNVASDNFVNCMSFSNVNQTSDVLAFPNPVGATGVQSVSVTSANGHYAVGAFESGAGIIPIFGSSIYTDITNGSLINAGGDYVQSVGASATVGVNSGSNASTVVGVDVSN